MMLAIIDGNNLAVRAYFAPGGDEETKGPSWVGYRVINTLLDLLEKWAIDYLDTRITEMVICFDGGNSLRREIYPEYKQKKDDPPEDLYPQIMECQRLLEEKGYATKRIKDYEADDLVSLISTWYHDKTVIISSDHDLLANVSSKTSMLLIRWTPATGTYISPMKTPEDVKELIGVMPEQIADFKGLAGDASDKIPGVPGIGPKTAARLIQKYNTIENVIEHAHELVTKNGTPSAVQKNLLANINMATTSRRLASPIHPPMFEFDFQLPEVL